MKVVIDTNVMISAFIKPQGVPGQIVRSVARFHLVASAVMMGELEKVLRYPHILHRYDRTEEQVVEFLAEIQSSITIVEVTVDATGATKDPKDDMFVACALSTNADYIVSGDHHLHSVGTFGETEVIQPAGFLVLLDLLKPVR